MKQLHTFYPLLFALFPLLESYARHLGHFRAATLLPALTVTLAVVSMVWILLSSLSRDRQKSAPLVAFFILVFFSHRAFVSASLWAFPSQSHLSSTIASVAILLLMMGALVVWITGRRSAPKFPFLDKVALFMLAAVVGMWGKYELVSGLHPTFSEDTEVVSAKTGPKPDIYYIILDGYARSDILEEIYGYDNQPFLQRLEELGFYIAAESRSNYAQTALSLSSSLNFGYLQDLVSELDGSSDDRRPLAHLLRNNRVHKFLANQGYRTVHLSTGYWLVDEAKADVVFRPFWPYLGFSRFVFTMTPLPSSLSWVGYRGMDHKSILNDQLARLRVSAESSPTFVLAHFVCPHPPFVFGEVVGDPRAARSGNDGSGIIGKGLLSRDEYVWNYKEQVRLFSAMILERIESLLSDSKNHPVIILQGDHGPASLDLPGTAITDRMQERLSILNAYLLPEGTSATLYPGITPVNTFRIIFNRYFGTNLKLLEDRWFYSLFDKPYDFTEATHEAAKVERRAPFLEEVDRISGP